MGDTFMASVFAVSNPGSGYKPALTDFPDENPELSQLHEFINTWDKEFAILGYTPYIRGIDPPAFIELDNTDIADYPELTAGGGITASDVENRRVKRLEIERANRKNNAKKLQLRTHTESMMCVPVSSV